MRPVSSLSLAVCAFAAAAAFVTITARPAAACSCVPAGPACEIFWKHDAVFVGKVVATQPIQGHFSTVNEATFDITEDFTGNLGSQIVVAGLAGCGYQFDRGVDYFVYASRSGAGYVTGSCSGTKPLTSSAAAADLAYARNRPQRPHAVIEGIVRAPSPRLDRHGDHEWLPRPGAVVSARGTTFSTRAGKDGRYQLDLPPGSYTLEVTSPGMRLSRLRPPAVTLKDPAACARRDLALTWDSRIRGQLLDHTGRPAVGVTVSAHPTGTTRSRSRLEGRTDGDGDYEIEALPPGTFRVAVSHPTDGGPDERNPIPTTYYPGTSLEAQARLITLKPSERVRGVSFKLPPPLAVFTISGVVHKQGTPLPQVNVTLETAPWNRGTGTTTDAGGRYSLREVEGASVTLKICRPDANPSNYPTACAQARRQLTGDVVVDLEMPP